MTPETIIQKAMADGVLLTLVTSDTIKAAGDKSKVAVWLPLIRQHKPSLVALLTPAPMTADEVQAIHGWLRHIGEIDPVTIAEVLNRCKTDSDARRYFLGRAMAGVRQKMP
ncbi:MAG: hypothetical protein V4623_00190 [Pseudomonadota bacterium]